MFISPIFMYWFEHICRAKVCLAVFLDKKSGKQTDLSSEFNATDESLINLKWREFGKEKIFQNKLRFQIRIDDFRERVTLMNSMSNENSKKVDVTDTEILSFYNKATMTLLTALEVSTIQGCQ